MSTQESGGTGGLAGLKAAMAAHAAGGQQEPRPRGGDGKPRYQAGTLWEQCGDWDCFSDEPPPPGIFVSMFSFMDSDEQMAYYKRIGWTRERSESNQAVYTTHEGDEATG